MKLEDQVCSLEFAKKLKELGVRQESLFYWRLDKPFVGSHEIDFSDPELRIVPHIASTKTQLELKRPKDSQYTITFSAFTVAELGEILPKGYRTEKQTYEEKEKRFKGEGSGITVYGTEANARAKMLIHLIEKGLVRP